MPWPAIALALLLLAAVPVTAVVLSRLRRGRLLARAGLPNLAELDLPGFIRYLATLLSGLGYQVERTPARSDYGVDLILTDGTGRRTAVHARHFNQPVDREVVDAVQEGAGYHRCQDALIVTAVRFTGAAISAAEETGAILWDLGDLADNMDKVRERPSFQAPPPASAASPAPPTGAPSAVAPARALAPAPAVVPVAAAAEGLVGPACPVCGRPMEARVAVGKEIWLCSRFPRCNGAMLRR